MRTASAVAMAWWLAGCGPLVPIEDTSDTTAESTGEGTATAPPPGTTAPPPGTTAPPGTTLPPGTSVGPTTSDESTTDEMTSVGFISKDGPGPPDMCTLWDQNCPRGEKCMPWANDGGGVWNDFRCSPIAPDPDAPGEPCTVEGSGTSGIDSCELGAMCWDVDPETNEGTCIAFCMGDESDPFCEDPETSCYISGGSVLALCLFDCDPLLQDCDPGDACYPTNESFHCVPDASGAMGGYGDPCEFINVCDPGYACLDSATVPPGEACEGAAGCCTGFCDASDPLGDAQCEGAAGGQTCQPWYEQGVAPDGYENIGVCALPL